MAHDAPPELSRIDPETFRDPPREFRHKFRWHWPGTAVDDRELETEIEEMARAGIGGAEISNLVHGIPPGDLPTELFNWGSQFWARRVKAALEAGATHGVGIDLTVGPSWPWASPAIGSKNINLAQQQLVQEQFGFSGPATFIGKPPCPILLGGVGHLVAVTAARLDVDSPIASPLSAEAASQDMLLLDPDSAVDLTPSLDGDGQLEWSAPHGTWIIFGFWSTPTHQRARSSKPHAGSFPLVIDHIQREAVQAALKHLDDQLLEPFGPACENFHELFEDSIELSHDGLLWTESFLTEFRQRRGYDLSPYLPVVSLKPWHKTVQGLLGRPHADILLRSTPGVSTQLGLYEFHGAAGTRVRRDYHQTLTELWIENHLLITRDWARKRRISYRAQVYGTTFDNIAAAKSVDIPEAEELADDTRDFDFWKTIASGAHLSGARKVSFEHGVGSMLDYMMTIPELKRRADRAFVSGINQIITHGYAYKHAIGAAWPTWSPFSSEYFWSNGALSFSDAWNDANTQWTHMRPFADYIARAQTILRAGHPVSDIAIYRDVYGCRKSGTSTSEPPLNIILSRMGFNYDFIDPSTLIDSATNVRDGRLIVQAPGYKALVVDLVGSHRLGVIDNRDAMSPAVLQRLIEFAELGLPIVFVGNFPTRGVSYCDPEKEDALVRQAVAHLSELARVHLVEDEGNILDALADLNVQGDVSFDRPLDVYSAHRRTADGDYWFFLNTGDHAIRFTGTFGSERRAPKIWDLWTGDSHLMTEYLALDDRVEVPIQLVPGETMALGFDESRCARNVITTDADEVRSQDGMIVLRSTRGGSVTATLSDGTHTTVDFGRLREAIEPDRWDLDVVGAVPEGEERHSLVLSELVDWREIPQLECTSGVGTYRTTITLDDSWASEAYGAYLKMSRVEGSIQIRANGSLVSPACVSLPRFDLGGFLHPGNNMIEVELATTLKNRLNSMADQENYRRFASRPQRTQPYGLIGPVVIVPYAERSIDP